MKPLTFMSIAILGVLAFGNGCDGGREGERCNPNLSHDECNDGLSCVQPATCVESYCCPAGPSSNPFCNGQACPSPKAVDAGANDGASD